MGQVGVWVLRWNGVTEDFQEDCYHVPDIVGDEFQSIQGQVAWVARQGQDTSDHLAFVEYELKSLWVQVHLEQKYLRHLIKVSDLPPFTPSFTPFSFKWLRHR